MSYIEVGKGVKIFVEDLNPDGEKTALFIHGWQRITRYSGIKFDQLPRHGSSPKIALEKHR
ncbi:hypothetical protein AXX12_17100 [Anaerosporomusa subterranea]|uniref:Alpha/beta hydrolase n=1 Tax=Anaerosporomusa subterranea TaxID=1794912 RepID=A0A154BUT2_ANASB|nr:hypothetical protein AXX12_17100 [Anaerosporomusa subterranea]